jgi:hypothetical protein
MLQRRTKQGVAEAKPSRPKPLTMVDWLAGTFAFLPAGLVAILIALYLTKWGNGIINEAQKGAFLWLRILETSL